MASELFNKLESQFGLPSGLLDSVWAAESGRGQNMRSPAGAMGHFQFMPATAKEYGLSNPSDLTQSATAAARKFADLSRAYKGDTPRMLAAYNWGNGNLDRNGLDKAPAETRNYIKKVSANMGMPPVGRDLSSELFGDERPVKPMPAAGRDLSAELFGDDVKEMPKRGFISQFGEDTKQTILAGLHGASNIGATLISPVDALTGYKTRKADTESGLKELGYDQNHFGGKAAKLTTEIAGTAGLGGGVANLARLIPGAARIAPLLSSISSGGMTVGGMTGAKAVATRAAGGALSGGLQAGLINPEDAGAGAAIGAALPGAFQLAGKAGRSMYQGAKQMVPNRGQMLADVLGVPAEDLPRIIAAAKSAPDAIVPGSKLTLNQALQLQGESQPGVKLLERIVAGGPGGDKLLKRFAEQGAARSAILEANGAKMYQGAAAEEAALAGDKIGSILRTQAGDDKAAARATWEALHGRAKQEGVMLQVPFDEMQQAMSPLGRGSVVKGADARAVLGEADNIGHLIIPAMDNLAPATANNSQTLERAVRAAGGIKGTSGELRDLGVKQSKTTGLVNNKSGQSADLLAAEMYRRGFIPDADPATLMDALRNGGGRNRFANDQVESNAMQRMMEQSMGDAPGEQKILQAVPFEEFQRLRRDSGSLASQAAEKPKTQTEAGVLAKFQELLTGRADSAASGNLRTGESMSQDFANSYNSAREMTKRNAELYKGGNNIASILRKPAGQDYALTGDEITRKLWHGGSGLLGDVANLKQTLSQDNYNPAMDQLRRYIMTDAASKTTASGDLAAGLPRYVETRMPGLAEALLPDQYQAVTNVASDIRNEAAANSVKGLLGSDTHAKITRAMSGGLLDSPAAKKFTSLASFKGVGLGAEFVRSKGADAVIAYKGKTLANLLADPKLAAKALENAKFVERLTVPQVNRLQAVAARSVPQLAAD